MKTTSLFDRFEPPTIGRIEAQDEKTKTPTNSKPRPRRGFVYLRCGLGPGNPGASFVRTPDTAW